MNAHPALKTWGKRALAVAALLAAVYAGWAKRSDLEAGSRLLGHIHYPWLALAIVLQLGSMLVFARLQRWLLRAGGVSVRLVDMVEITFAGNALGTSLPGGAAWAATWAFGQLRRRGADRVLAGWVILVAGAFSSFALFCVVAAGSWVAGSRGPVAHLRWLALLLAAIPPAAAVGVVLSRRSPRVGAALRSAYSWSRRRVPGASKAGDAVSNVVERLHTVRPGTLGWIEVLGLALLNWLDDCGTMVAAMLALGVHVPWRGVLVIYGLTQVSASLPITPGGLGVVEGSMAALLSAYGLNGAEAFGTVLLYRIVSFWGLVPLGWGAWFTLEYAQRTGKRRRPHPWAEHTHGGAAPVAGRRVGPDRLRQPDPCPGCEEREERRAVAAR